MTKIRRQHGSAFPDWTNLYYNNLDENPAESSEEERKVSFKKPSTFKKPPSVESTSKPSAAVQDGHKRILPEYEFGQKAKKSVVKLSDKTTSEKSGKIKSQSKTISLSHLDEEDEGDSDWFFSLFFSRITEWEEKNHELWFDRKFSLNKKLTHFVFTENLKHGWKVTKSVK